MEDAPKFDRIDRAILRALAANARMSMIDLARQGIAVAPGSAFGPYPTHFRVCFTGDPPDKVLRGMEKLACRLS